MKIILLVGNCDLDHPRLTNIIESSFDAKVIRAETLDKAKHLLERKTYDLIAVNRTGAFDGEEGLNLIKFTKENNIKTKIMLITNYKDAMQESIKEGAVEGFGKSLSDNKIKEFLKKHLS